jgi:hypothetical protein
MKITRRQLRKIILEQVQQGSVELDIPEALTDVEFRRIQSNIVDAFNYLKEDDRQFEERSNDAWNNLQEKYEKGDAEDYAWWLTHLQELIRKEAKMVRLTAKTWINTKNLDPAVKVAREKGGTWEEPPPFAEDYLDFMKDY